MLRTYFLKIFKLFLVLFYLCCDLGCSLFVLGNDSSASPGELEILAQAEKFLTEGQLEKSVSQFQKFQKDYPRSKFLLSARLGEGQTLEMQGQLDKAIEVYQDVYDRSVSINPEMAILAQYRQSFAFEKKGDDFKALTKILDLKPHEKYLPLEVSKIQIPGRLALLYNKLGQTNEASNYQLVATKNLENLKNQISGSKLAESYLLIGSLNTIHANEENFSVYIRGLKISSHYLLSSIELNQEKWSEKSQDLLRKQIGDLWGLVLTLPVSKNSDPQVAQRKRHELQTQMTNEIIEILKTAELRKPLHLSEYSIYQKNIFEFIDKIEKNAQNILMSGTPRVDLTEESKKAFGLKRKGKLVLAAEEEPKPKKRFKKR